MPQFMTILGTVHCGLSRPKMDFFETCGSSAFSFILPLVRFPCVRGRGGGHGQQTDDVELVAAICADHQRCGLTCLWSKRLTGLGQCG